MPKIKDIVKSKNPNLPFTMVVVLVDEEFQLARCNFCYSGKPAGVFNINDLVVVECKGEEK